jgi:hypothetical protein
MAQWNNITEAKPKPDQEVLVSIGDRMIVSSAYFYNEEQRAEYASWATDDQNAPFTMHEEDKKHYLECEGYFEEFGTKYYFDNSNVFWQELPRKPSPEANYWEDQKVISDIKTWMDNLHGSILCNCGHGCRNWIADNGGKAYRIIEALMPALDNKETLDEIVKTHTDLIGLDIWNERTKK